MIWELVKRDPAWRTAWLVSGAVAIIFTATTAGKPAGFYQVLVLVALVQSRLNERATLLEAGLPIAARDIICGRLLSLLAVVWMPLAVMATLSLVERKPTEPYLHLLEMAALLTVIVLAAQSWDVHRLSSPRWIVILACALTGASVSAANVLILSVWVGLAGALVSAALLLGIWLRIPLAFEVMPASSAPARASFRSFVPRRFVWMPVLRAAFPFSVLGFAPMMLMSNWMWGTLFCVFPAASALSRLGWLRCLPIRPATLMLWLMLPGLLPPLAGIFLGFNIVRQPLQWDWLPDNRASELRPPLEFWRTAPAPAITAPWGETWQPPTQSLRGVAIYNPYGNGPANSRRFFEWQFQRATTAVFGHPVSFDAYRHAKSAWRPLTRQPRFLLLDTAVCLFWELLMVNALLLGMHWRLQRLPGKGSAGWIALYVVQFGFLVYVDLMGPKTGFPQVAASLVNALVLGVSNTLPATLPAALPLALLPAALLSCCAWKLFGGVEAPAVPPPTAWSTK